MQIGRLRRRCVQAFFQRGRRSDSVRGQYHRAKPPFHCVFRVSQPPKQRNRVEISADLRSRQTFHRNNLHLGSILSRVHRIVCIARRKLWHSIFFTVSMQLLSEYLSHLHLLAATDFTMCTTKDQKYLACVENIS